MLPAVRQRESDLPVSGVMSAPLQWTAPFVVGVAGIAVLRRRLASYSSGELFIWLFLLAVAIHLRKYAA